MRDRIIDLLEKVDLAVAESVGVVSPEDLGPIAEARNEIRTRLAYPDSILVAGLVGGTGSGKSSLLNSLAGEDVSAAGGLRPTTGEPVAYLPETHAEAMAGYLDHLGVRRRAYGDGTEWLCLLDLPDTDSVVVDHRHRVDTLLPVLDIIIWVLDPEKYRDASIHHEISRLSAYQDQFFFVLNQIDRIPSPALADLEADLAVALDEDGVISPRLFLTAANPAAGPPIGVEALARGLGVVSVDRSPVYKKLLEDLMTASTTLIGVTSGARSLDFEQRWADTILTIAPILEKGRTSEAIYVIAELVDTLADESSDETSAELRRISLGVPDVFAGAFADAAAPPATTRWWRRRDLAAQSAGGSLSSQEAALEEGVARPIRRLLQQRARCHAAIASFHLSLLDVWRHVE